MLGGLGRARGLDSTLSGKIGVLWRSGNVMNFVLLQDCPM